MTVPDLPTDVSALLQVVELLLGILTLVAGVLGGFWAYSRFVVERGLLPAVQFDVGCRRLGGLADSAVLDVGMHLKNTGSSTLVARNLRLDILYSPAGREKVAFLRGPGRAGRLEFSGSLKEDLKLKPEEEVVPRPSFKKKERRLLATRGLPILEGDIFVQPGVDQRFGFATALPPEVSMVLVWGAFEYAQMPSGLQRVVLWLARRLGMVQFTLAHISRPHTVERVFDVGNDS